MDHIKLKAEEDTEAELFQQYGADPDRMVSELQKEALVALKIVENLREMKAMEAELTGANQEGEDPLVALKAQELAQRAEKDKADFALGQERLKNEQMRIMENAQANDERIQSQEKIARERTEVARERIYAPKGG